MRLFILSILLLCSTILSIGAQYSAVEMISIESEELNQTRTHSYYNVIYVFDAQNRKYFDFVSSLAMLSKEANRGFIVVGVRATTLTEEVDGETKFTYFRNMDMLPSDTDFFRGRYKGNSEAFLAFIKNELVPHIEEEYRVLPGRMAVGHSLSASFLIYTLLNEPALFDSYVAISPNLDYDNERLLHGLRSFNTKDLGSVKHLYVSHGDEGQTFGWQESIDKGYPLLKDTLASDKLKVTVESYPEEDHNSVFIHSMISAMDNYMKNIRPKWNTELSDETYEVTIRLKVPAEGDEIYISGNQRNLADWAQDQIKMKKVSPFMREITLELKDHAEILFHKDGKSQAWISFGDGGRSSYAMMIRPKEGSEYTFEVESYMN